MARTSYTDKFIAVDLAGFLLSNLDKGSESNPAAAAENEPSIPGLVVLVVV